MRLDLLEGVRTLQWSSLHSSHASGITDILIEVKRVATKLAAKHLRQVEMYAVNEGVEWVLLTNGAVWQVYHLSGGLPVMIDLAFEANLLSEETVTQRPASSST
jgi:hypothetical protein